MDKVKIKYYHRVMFFSLVFLFVSYVFLITFVGDAVAQCWKTNAHWTTVGSAGIVAETDLDEVFMTDHYAGVRTLNNAYVTMRYNIVALPGLLECNDEWNVGYMDVTYEDSGDNTRVVVKLIEKPLNGGSQNILMEFDSDDYPQTPTVFAGPKPHREQIQGDRFSKYFNFEENAYYIKVQMSRQQAQLVDRIGIHSIKLCCMGYAL